AAGAPTIRLAADRMPRRCAASMASLTGIASPKSSPVTMRRGGDKAGSAFPVEQQADADRQHADRPGPARGASGPPRQPDLEPARPAGGDAEQRQRHMRDLDQQLLAHIAEAVGV